MHIEYVVTKRPSCDSIDRKELATTPLEQHLIDLDGEVRDEKATKILCLASAWAYSDLTTFAAHMCPHGLYGEFVGINIQNDAAFVDTTAYLFVSDTKKLAILTFRGTELTNSVNWVMDASAGMRMIGEGGIHAGFLTAAISVLPLLRALLLHWSENTGTLADAVDSLRTACYPEAVFPKEEQFLRERGKAVKSERLEPPEETALYVCGHSLGGAFASLAGAELYLRPALLPVKRRLRSIYTFGAPAWGDATIVDTLEEKGLGKRVFRHRNEKDIVPLLPGRNQGAYKHLGCSYKSLDGVWVRSADVEEQVRLGLFALASALLPFFTEAMSDWKPLGIKWFSTQWLAGLLLRYSWPDHKPDRYLSVSLAPTVGFELLGGDLDARASGLSCLRRNENEKS